MPYNKISFTEMHQELMEHQENLKEAADAGKIIDELISTSFGGDNESQMKAVQLLKGLATSDDPASNAFMKKLDNFTSGMKKSESFLSESIKSMLDQLSDDRDEGFKPKMTKKGKIVTLMFKKGEADRLAKQYKEALRGEMDKIKHIGAEKSGSGVKLEIELN